MSNLRVPTSEEAREIGRKGGIASGESRRKKKTMKEVASLLLGMEVSSSNIKTQMKAMGIPDEDLTNQMAIVIAMLQKASKGDTKAFELLMSATCEDIRNRELKEKIRHNKAEEKLKEMMIKQEDNKSNSEDLLKSLLLQSGSDIDGFNE